MTGARFELAISRFLFIAKKLITHSAMHMSLALYQAELPRHGSKLLGIFQYINTATWLVAVLHCLKVHYALISKRVHPAHGIALFALLATNPNIELTLIAYPATAP
jgi:hypothetical protein